MHTPRSAARAAGVTKSAIYDGNNIVEHLAGLDNHAMAVAAYWAAVAEKLKDKITLRQGARVVMKSWTDVLRGL